MYSEMSFFKCYAQILAILIYGSELSGFQQFGVLEKAHLFVCKILFNVGLQTRNKMVYDDSGRYPLFITAVVRCVEYWLRITSLSEDRFPPKAYNMLLY